MHQLGRKEMDGDGARAHESGGGEEHGFECHRDRGYPATAEQTVKGLFSHR